LETFVVSASAAFGRAERGDETAAGEKEMPA